MHVGSRLSAAAGVLALASVGVPAVAAEDVGCGDLITASTQLTRDLHCTGEDGDGLTIAASGAEAEPLVLDLNGHTLAGGGERGLAGIRFTGQNNVVVRNGTITGFHVGVEVQQSMRVTLTGLTVHGIDRGINVGGGGYHLIEKNTATAEQRDGIRLGATTNNYVVKNTVPEAVWGISIAGYTTSNFIEKNTVTGSVRHGIGAFDNARAVTIVKNEVAGNYDGIFVGKEVLEAHLEKNEAADNREDGIHVDTASAKLIKNIATGNTGLGILAVEGVSGSGNVASGNLAGGAENPTQCVGVECAPA
ncbi:right-handed parallel beta-helix repeat-containing protein [Granulicoccus sp. GXG6511]|uniref:right-handed parallel beta-helix repeat-containing protein n=1 Tax=Granulicoccus sp. GXG6511 TaxID=3381351 RepID=UPI003D7DF970